MKFDFTTGPWEIGYKHKTSINKGEKHIAMINYFVCHDKKSTVDEKEHEANVKLIARAPELLEALIDQLKVKLCITGNIAYVEDKKAIDAIEKATGKKWEEIIGG